jgi:hypothetical protein
VRDANLANATFSVVVASTGIAEPAAPFTATPGSYKADPAFANKSLDVAMRCLSRRFDWEKKTTESTSVAVVSLRFDATGKLTRCLSDPIRIEQRKGLGGYDRCIAPCARDGVFWKIERLHPRNSHGSLLDQVETSNRLVTLG